MSGRERGRSGDEVKWRRAEQQLFAARAAVAPAPPPFGAVLAAARRSGGEARDDAAFAAQRSRWAPWVGLSFAAAVSALCVLPRATVEDAPAAEVTAEPLPSAECYDDRGSPVAEGAVYAPSRFFAVADEPERSPITTGECALPLESDVACVAYRPVDYEIVEDMTRGESLQ